jgi:hypothetical protein
MKQMTTITQAMATMLALITMISYSQTPCGQGVWTVVCYTAGGVIHPGVNIGCNGATCMTGVTYNDGPTIDGTECLGPETGSCITCSTGPDNGNLVATHTVTRACNDLLGCIDTSTTFGSKIIYCTVGNCSGNCYHPG